mmetsp:Transcript_32103/g.36502  ORF Transcript_32103/g.36502 Transcript_32103/m.36502 type:complete len:94 (-) Transcript_32103:39-320(-)
MSHPDVHALIDRAISSPIKHQGKNGSKGTSIKNSALAKKKPAAMKGICVGRVSLPLYPVPVLMRMMGWGSGFVSQVHNLAPLVSLTEGRSSEV